MKLRILGNSIRLRLTQTEVSDLARLGKVSETTQFGPDNLLVYELMLTTNEELLVSFQDGKISVALPTTIGQPWANSSEISLRKEIHSAEGNHLSVLIEKDFKCKTKRVGENEDDMFPNPDC